MPDIFAINVVPKIKWIKQLLIEPQGKWQCLTCFLLNIAKGKLTKKLPPTQSFKCLSPFHRQDFDCWVQFHGVPPKSFIFNNKFTFCGDKPLQSLELRIQKIDTHNLVIGNSNGCILSFEEFTTKANLNIEILSYNKTIDSIPRTWKNTVKTKIYQML